MIASTNVRIVSISCKFTNNCHNLIGIQRIRKDLKHFAGLCDAKLIRTIDTDTVDFDCTICKFHFLFSKVSCDASILPSANRLVKHEFSFV